jgi:hypothetical protein
MATKISELPSATTLDYTETLPIVQSGTTKKATIEQILAESYALADYTALRAYTGSATSIRITGVLASAQPQGIAGQFQKDTTDTTSGCVFTGSITTTVLTVSAVTNGTLSVGQAINRGDTGATVAYITSLGTGAGGIGTYNLSASATVTSMTMTADNGGTVLVAENGVRWKRQFDDVIQDKWFAPTGDGVAVDYYQLNACVSALNSLGKGWLDFDGIYNLGNDGGVATTKFNITASGVGLRFSAKTKFLVRNDSAQTVVFASRGVSNLKTEGQLRVESDAATPYSQFGTNGAKALVIYNASAADCGNIELDSIYLTRGSGAVFVTNYSGYSSANRVNKIRIGSIVTVDATYGFNAQNNGDDVVIDVVDTDNATRSYFSYGARKHKAYIRSKNTQKTPINLTRYSPTTDGGAPVETTDYRLDVDVIDGTYDTIVSMNHIGDSTSSQKISNVKIDIRSNVNPGTVLRLYNYVSGGASVTATAFNALVDDVTINLNNVIPTITVDRNVCTWVTKPNVYWFGGTISAAAWWALKSIINIRWNIPSASFTPEEHTLNNGLRIAHYDNAGSVWRLIGSDTSNNIHIGEPRTDAMYAAVYGGSTGIYLSAKGASRLQVTDSALRPVTTGTMALGTSANKFLSGYTITQTVETLNVVTTTVAGLPAAGTAGAGARKFVTDATATTFASIVAGGGANKVPVYSDGTNWLIG